MTPGESRDPVASRPRAVPPDGLQTRGGDEGHELGIAYFETSKYLATQYVGLHSYSHSGPTRVGNDSALTPAALKLNMGFT